MEMIVIMIRVVEIDAIGTDIKDWWIGYMVYGLWCWDGHCNWSLGG